MKRIFSIRSKCSNEPKTVILAHSSKAETETEPFWLTICDAPYREIPTILRLRRCRGMRHTGKVGIALIHRGPRKVVRLFGERRSSGMDELSRSRGSEGIRACDDASHTVASRTFVCRKCHRRPSGQSAILRGHPLTPGNNMKKERRNAIE